MRPDCQLLANPRKGTHPYSVVQWSTNWGSQAPLPAFSLTFTTYCTFFSQPFEKLMATNTLSLSLPLIFFPLIFMDCNPYKKSKGWWRNIKKTKQSRNLISGCWVLFFFSLFILFYDLMLYFFFGKRSNVILKCIIYSFSLLLLPIILFLSPSINLSCTLLMRGTGRVKLLNLH